MHHILLVDSELLEQHKTSGNIYLLKLFNRAQTSREKESWLSCSAALQAAVYLSGSVALSHPQVYGVFEVFRFKVELKFQSVFVRLQVALSF